MKNWKWCKCPQKEMKTLQYSQTRKYHAVTKNNVFEEMLITEKKSSF